MKNIVDEVQDSVEAIELVFENDATVKSFQDALVEFESMVQNGMAQKRGYNLLSLADRHLHTPSFNSIVDSNTNSILSNI